MKRGRWNGFRSLQIMVVPWRAVAGGGATTHSQSRRLCRLRRLRRPRWRPAVWIRPLRSFCRPPPTSGSSSWSSSRITAPPLPKSPELSRSSSVDGHGDREWDRGQLAGLSDEPHSHSGMHGSQTFTAELPNPVPGDLQSCRFSLKP